MKYALLAVVLCMVWGCRAPKSAEQKQYEATQKELALLQALRVKYPCDTATQTVTVRDTAIIFTSDTTYVPGYTDTTGLSSMVKVITRYKTIERNIDRVVKVIDMAALRAARDSAAQSMYLFNQCAEGVAPVVKQNTDLKAEVSNLKGWKTWTITGISGLIAASVFFGIFKLKSKII